jgi:hypothetical protein
MFISGGVSWLLACAAQAVVNEQQLAMWNGHWTCLVLLFVKQHMCGAW